MGTSIKFLLGILLFGLFYFESIIVGGLKFAVLWKIPVLIYMFLALALEDMGEYLSCYRIRF